MKQCSSISRRILAALEAYQSGHFELACIHLFPAMDKTAKKKRPKDGVGDRIRKFLAEQEDIISVVATGNYIVGNRFGQYTFPEAIYKFWRTSIAHEGELDSRLEFTKTGIISIGEKWSLPSTYILSMSIAVMAASENSNENLGRSWKLNILGEPWSIDDLWGAETRLREKLHMRFPAIHKLRELSQMANKSFKVDA